MSPRLRLTLPILLGLAACVGPDQPIETEATAQQVPRDDPGGPPTGGGGGDDGLPTVCKTVTVSGRIFYDDLRARGRFLDRSTLIIGSSGTRDHWDAPGTDRQNYLGMKGAKISIYEVDDPSSYDHADCWTTALAGSTHADRDGLWSWTGQVCDECRWDEGEGANDGNVSVAAKVSLDYCPDPEERCFSVDDPGTTGLQDHYADGWSGTTWSRWWRGADTTTPRVIANGTPVSLGFDYFQTNLPAVLMQATDLYAQAASVFASMIDVTERVHVVEGVDFDHATWGKIRAYFPSPVGGTAHSHQAGRFCVAAPQTRDDNDPSLYLSRSPDTWINGDETTHEYGHLVHYWQWGGVGKWQSFCKDSDGDGHIDIAVGNLDLDYVWYGDGDGKNECDESSAQREYTGTAFKEGWASFISRVTFKDASTNGACSDLDGRVSTALSFPLFDGSLLCPVGASICTAGRHFYGDVEQALCEFYDGDVDDTLQVSLLELVAALGHVFDAADPADQDEIIDASTFGPQDTSNVALGLCNFAAHLDDSHGFTTAALESALTVAQIDCQL